MTFTENKNNITWSVHTTHPEIIEPLLENLRKVVDPEISLNIIELGLVREVVVQEDSAEVTMMMTTPFCPYAPALLETTRRQAEEVIGKPTTIEMSMEPWDPSFMEESVGREWGFF
jgi:metal-sulfur cluster biosynthetic enzyme